MTTPGRGDGLADERRGRAGALDLGDGPCRSPAGVGGGAAPAAGLGAPAVKSAALFAVLAWRRCARPRWCCSAPGRGRCRRSRWPWCRSRRSRRRARRGVAVGAAGQRGGGVDQRDLAGRAAHRDGAGRRRTRTSAVPPVPGGLADDVGRRPPASVPASAVVRQVVPVAEAYCTDQPARSPATALVLYSSTKSLVVGGAGVAAAAVHLVDHHRGRSAKTACAEVGRPTTSPATRASAPAPPTKLLRRARMSISSS